MVDLRRILSETLINKLNIDPIMLSRVEGDKPVCIELNNGSAIYINVVQDSLLLTFVEVPFSDMRVINLKSPDILKYLTEDNELFLSVNENKFILHTYIDKNMDDFEQNFLNKLVSLNEFTEIFN